MANEFIIKNGYRSQGNSEVTGSLRVTTNISASDALFTNSLRVTGPTQITGSVDVQFGNVNLRSNAYFFNGSNTTGVNVSLIGVDSNNVIRIGNQGYLNEIESATNIDGDTQITGSLNMTGSLFVKSQNSVIATNYPNSQPGEILLDTDSGNATKSFLFLFDYIGSDRSFGELSATSPLGQVRLVTDQDSLGINVNRDFNAIRPLGVHIYDNPGSTPALETGTYINISGSNIENFGDVYVTGSLTVSSSLEVIGTETLIGDLRITGSILATGSHISSIDYIDFDTGSAEPAWKSGRVFWNNTDGALSVYNAEQDITLQVGQENWTRVRNNTGTTITNGTVVRVIGSQGDAPTIERAQSIAKSGSINLDTQILGVATHDIENTSFGYVTTQGLVRGLNTNAFNDGDTLFVGTGSAGVLQNTAPIAPYEIIPVGVCVNAGPGGSGIIYVAVQQPLDFSDLSSVEKSGSYNYSDLWTYVPSGSLGVWRHTNQLSGSYGLTGSLNVTGSTNVIGAITLTGSLDASGSFSVTGTQTYTGSFSVSGSFDVIGRQTNTGSLFITGSSTDRVELLVPVTSSQNISSSLDIIARTGSFDYLLDRGDAVIDGDLVVNGALTLAGGLQFGPTFATASLIANTNNLLISNLANSILIRISTTGGNFSLTGIVVPDNTKTFFFNVFNVGSAGNIIFKNNDAGSTAQNRFLVGGDITVQPGEGLSFIYDPVDLRWRSPGKNI